MSSAATKTAAVNTAAAAGVPSAAAVTTVNTATEAAGTATETAAARISWSDRLKMDQDADKQQQQQNKQQQENEQEVERVRRKKECEERRRKEQAEEAKRVREEAELEQRAPALALKRKLQGQLQLGEVMHEKVGGLRVCCVRACVYVCVCVDLLYAKNRFVRTCKRDTAPMLTAISAPNSQHAFTFAHTQQGCELLRGALLPYADSNTCSKLTLCAHIDTHKCNRGVSF